MDIKLIKYEKDKNNTVTMRNIDREKVLQNKKAKVLNMLEERKVED